MASKSRVCSWPRRRQETMCYFMDSSVAFMNKPLVGKGVFVRPLCGAYENPTMVR